MDPEGKADHGSARITTTEEGSEEVKAAEKEKQKSKMEVDEVIPGTQPSSNEADGEWFLPLFGGEPLGRKCRSLFWYLPFVCKMVGLGLVTVACFFLSHEPPTQSP